MSIQPYEPISRLEHGNLVDGVFGNFSLFRTIHEFAPEITRCLYVKYKHDIQNEASRVMITDQHRVLFRKIMEEFRLVNIKFLTAPVSISYQWLVDEFEQEIVNEMNELNELGEMDWIDYTADKVKRMAIKCMKRLISFFFARGGLLDTYFEVGMGDLPFHPEPIPTVLDTLFAIQTCTILNVLYVGEPLLRSRQSDRNEELYVLELLRNADLDNPYDSFFGVVNDTREMLDLPRHTSREERSFSRHQVNGSILFEDFMLRQVQPGVWESIMAEDNDDVVEDERFYEYGRSEGSNSEESDSEESDSEESESDSVGSDGD
jgi:hypothetical protein